MKKPELIKPEKFKTALETKRDTQREEIMSYVNKNADKLMKLEGWLQALSQLCEKIELMMLGLPLCDAIVYPRCFLIFGNDIKEHNNQLTIFLKSHDIPVRSVGNVSTNEKSVAFVYLTDSDNLFTAALIQNLDKSLEDLAL